MTDIGLYVHVPFCARKCGYCDFYSIVPEGSQVDDLVDALLRELNGLLAGRNLRAETIFVGGGTPTMLPFSALERLMGGLGRVVEAHRPIEFTVEANPGSLTEAKAALLRDAGVNRISMGAQSFHDDELRVLGRLHGSQDIAAGVEVVRRLGFEHVNLDLIFGIPGQSIESWTESLRQAVDLGPDHLACYGLTYEPGTPLAARRDRGEVVPMDEDLETELYFMTIDLLAEAGFEHYEISNFARLGGRCHHNLRYWRCQPGIGVGPAAASYLDGRRWRNFADVDEYVSRIRSGRSVIAEVETLSPLWRAGEMAMLRLRMIEGIDCDEFRAQTGFDPCELFAEGIRRHAEAGLLVAGSDRIALTRKGLVLADAVVRDFLPSGGG